MRKYTESGFTNQLIYKKLAKKTPSAQEPREAIPLGLLKCAAYAFRGIGTARGLDKSG